MDALKDRALIESVREHLMKDKRLAGQSIDVTASEGYIQIVGVVDSEEHRHIALELACGIAGVHHVEDLLEVHKVAAA